MYQEIIAYIIIAFSFSYACYRLYRFFKNSSDENKCAPGDCDTCPYQREEGCSEDVLKNSKTCCS